MSSKKFICLFMVAIVCGFIAGGIAHGQSTDSFRIEGTVTNPDGTPAAWAADTSRHRSLYIR